MEATRELRGLDPAEQKADHGPAPAVDPAAPSPGPLAEAGNGALSTLLGSAAAGARQSPGDPPRTPPALGAGAVAALQQSAGNGAVARLLSGAGSTPAPAGADLTATPAGPDPTAMPAAGAPPGPAVLAPALPDSTSAASSAGALATPASAVPGFAPPASAAPAPAVPGSGPAAPSVASSGGSAAAGAVTGTLPAAPAVPTPAPAASSTVPAGGGDASPVRKLDLPPAATAIVAVPNAVDEGAQEVVAAIAAAGSEGQAALAAAVGEQLASIAAVVETQQAGIDEGAAAQLAAVDSAFGDAAARLGAAIAGAQQQLATAHQSEQQRLAAWSAETQQQLFSGYADRTARIQAGGVTAGNAVVSSAEGIATDTGTEVDGLAQQARTAGAARAAAPGGADADGAGARAAAAREVSGDTAKEISGKLGTTVGELRGLGPETQAQLVSQANLIAMRIQLRMPTVAAVLGETTAGAGAQLSQAVAAGSASLAAFGAELSGQLGGLRTTVMNAVRQQADAAKESVFAAGQQTVEAGRAQHAQAAAAGAALLDGVLAGVANRKIRRAAAARLSGELSGHVRQGFGDAEQQARVMLAEIAQVFSETAGQALDVLLRSSDQARQHASGVAGQGEDAAAGQATSLAAQFAELTTAATGSGSALVGDNLAGLDQIIADLDTRFGQVLTDFRTSLTQKAAETTGKAREPVATLDGRMTKAMREAEEATHRSWLEKAWDSIPWGTIAGVIVGLVVTIAVVALLGTGIGALIVAGALSGALSAAATTLTDNAVHGRDTNWGDLGKQMLVGAAFGAVGGAIGGGVAGALGGAVERQAITEVTAVAVGKGVNVVTGATLGVVNNIAAGRPWHEGLLTNIGLSMALSYGPGGRFIEGATQSARGAMVDNGAAFNVTAAEASASSVRTQAPVDTGTEPVLSGPVEEPVMDMPEGTVMSGEKPMTEAEARTMYENARRDAPHHETGVYRNSETGECIVVQGNNEYIDAGAATNSAMKEFLESRPGEPGRWELVEHSHPVDPATGVTHEAHRYPSGSGGDFDVARLQSERNGGKPVEQTIGIVTERGNETVTYGYDPGQAQPYSLTRPGPDGRPVTVRFKTMEAYGEWYESQPGTGGGSPHIDGDPATAVAAAPGRDTVADLKQRAYEAAARAEELRRGDWAAHAESLRKVFAELEGLAETPEQIHQLVPSEVAQLEALEGQIPPRPPEFEEGAHTKLSQPGGLAATEGTVITPAGGEPGPASHALKEHGPQTDSRWLKGMAADPENRSGIAAKYLDRAVMETATGDAIAAAQTQIDEWLATDPPPAAGENLRLPLYDPGLGNLGTGFQRNPVTRAVEPIPAGTPLTRVQVILKATGNTGPGRPYIIQTTYPTV